MPSWKKFRKVRRKARAYIGSLSNRDEVFASVSTINHMSQIRLTFPPEVSIIVPVSWGKKSPDIRFQVKPSRKPTGKSPQNPNSIFGVPIDLLIPFSPRPDGFTVRLTVQTTENKHQMTGYTNAENNTKKERKKKPDQEVYFFSSAVFRALKCFPESVGDDFARGEGGVGERVLVCVQSLKCFRKFSFLSMFVQ